MLQHYDKSIITTTQSNRLVDLLAACSVPRSYGEIYRSPCKGSCTDWCCECSKAPYNYCLSISALTGTLNSVANLQKKTSLHVQLPPRNFITLIVIPSSLPSLSRVSPAPSNYSVLLMCSFSSESVNVSPSTIYCVGSPL